MNYKKWLDHKFSTGCYAGEDYLKFQKEMRTDLRKQAVNNGLVIYSFNKNHYEFSAVLKSAYTDKFVYVQIPDVRFFQNEWFTNVLYRTMANEKDWTGGLNQYCRWEDIGKSAAKLTV